MATSVFLSGISHGQRSLVGCSQSMVLLGVRHDFTFTFTFHFHALGNKMATHSSILAWGIPGKGACWAAIYGVAQSQTRLK